ncbi:rfaE bifunctional protein, domain II [Desulfacinum hydrothermale DSM 13146]|uniref:RfaE bifunctional protein, domain II n=1 Tax=Desulfacinum hydrothermale DSM 13146 TaxID=1121390 RepID=A0A1W1WZ65_9BACT|nr:rfaE bifunctional protein, domain II [Desulfacinum hydrothermale DSM 13146]
MLCGELRRKGRRLVFTNGCFDLLHVGHLRYLEAAAALGDFLVVGVNSDRSVQAIKGSQRPIVPEWARSEMVAGLHCVDCVVVFDTPDPLLLIQRLTPHVLVKGADWPEDRIVGADWVRSHGGRVERIPLVEGFSSTFLIEKILGLTAP